MTDEDVLDLADTLHELIRARRAKRLTQRYAVLQSGPEWQIVCGRRRMGHFQTRELAVEAAARLVRVAKETGRPVEFLVQGPAGELMRHDPDCPFVQGLRRSQPEGRSFAEESNHP